MSVSRRTGRNLETGMEAAISSARYWRETADNLEKKVAQLRIRVSGRGNSEHARRGSSRELEDSYPTSLQDDFEFPLHRKFNMRVISAISDDGSIQEKGSKKRKEAEIF